RTVQDWSGGTRIGEALRTFNYRWLRRVLPASGVVLIISDGLDRGDPELLAREMARLSRSCYRLIWLNPLLRYEHYRPLTRGMRAALPYIDHFLPVHNLASLEQLGRLLASLDRRTPGTVVAE
ncbi:VWA domain-containing protein, partial [Rhodothermus marinus]